MAEHYARSVLKVSMAQICQNLGWNSVNSSPLEILVDILHRYLRTLAKSTHTFSEHYNRTEPNLDDLGLAFKEMGISLAELEEYINNVEPVPFVHSVPRFPIQRNNKFHFLRDGSREVQQRPEWINSHLPPMYSEEEDVEPVLSPMEVMEAAHPSDGANGFAGETGSPLDSPRPGSRRPLEISHDTNFSTPKRQRLHSDEEGGRSFREVIGVTMTAAGIISPVMEGRLPDTCTPSKGFDDSLPNSPVTAPMSPASPLPMTPIHDIVEEEVEAEKNTSKTEEIVSVKKPSKLKEPKKVKKDNKENKKKKDLKLQLAKKHTAKLKCVGKSLKHKEGTGEGSSTLLKSPKVGRPKGKSPKSKSVKSTKNVDDDLPLDLSKTPTKQSKKPKSPKGTKLKVKSPKAEKQIPGGQLASLLAKVSGIKVEKGAESVKMSQNLPTIREPDVREPKKEWLDLVSAENSPERLVIDDNDDCRNKITRLSSLDACISAVIQRGLKDGVPVPIGSAHALQSRSDLDSVSTPPAKIKLEPRDVYDFTDDDDDDGQEKDDGVPVDTGTPTAPALPSPCKKKSDEKSSERSKDGKKVKSKSKEGEKRSKSKNKSKSPKHIKTEVEAEHIKHPPRTPEVRDDDSDSESFSRLQATPMMMGLGSSSFTNSMNPFHPLSQIPPALLPFPMPAFPGSTPPSAGGSSMSPRAQVPYPKLVDLADVAISKARHDGDFDVGRSKEKEKDRERDKKKEKREKKEKDKLKSKKKKDKLKEKGSGKGVSEKERDKSKSKKDKLFKVKGKGRKEEKTKDKDKKKDKGKEKSKEKKPEKKKYKEKGIKKEKADEPMEDIESDSTTPSVTSAIPRLTFKLGSGSTSEVPKIVIKNISVDSPSCSPAPPKEVSPPRTPTSPLMPVPQASSGKSHPKPQSKVQPVPPAPARTVITETVGTIIDDSGAKIWICPACTHPDDGSPMIGCDECDEWYHWICVNIVVPPKEEEEWFCTRCLARKHNPQRRKKHRKEK